MFNFRFSTTVLLLAMSPLLIQCVPSQDLTNLDLRIRNLDNRLVKIDKTIAVFDGHGEDNPIEQIQRKQAEMSDNLDRVNMEILQIKGQLEENNHLFRTFQSENDKIKINSLK